MEEFCFAASHFEFFFLMMHKNFNSDLRVVSGAMGLHETEINKVVEKEAVEQLFNFSTSLKNLNLAFDEIILVRGISVTFTGNYTNVPTPLSTVFFSFVF